MNQTKKMIKRTFPNSLELDLAFAKCIAELLNQSIEEQGSVGILFSGGSTPAKFFGELAKQDVNWGAVKIGLVDDRMVPASSEHSNNKLLNSSLMDLLPEENRPRFFPLVTHPFNASNNMLHAIESSREFGVPDIVILGMGGDGHFASLFPSDEPSGKALRQMDTRVLVNTNAPSAPKFRISHSWGYLRQAKNIFVHITGKNKLQIIEGHASRSEYLPIDYVLADPEVELTLFWAP